MRFSHKLKSACSSKAQVALETNRGARFIGVIVCIKPLKLKCDDKIKSFEGKAIAKIEYV